MNFLKFDLAKKNKFFKKEDQIQPQASELLVDSHTYAAYCN